MLIVEKYKRNEENKESSIIFSFPSYCQEIFGSEDKIALNGKSDKSLESIKLFKLSKTIKSCFDHQKKNYCSLWFSHGIVGRYHQNMCRNLSVARSLTFWHFRYSLETNIIRPSFLASWMCLRILLDRKCDSSFKCLLSCWALPHNGILCFAL